MLSDAISLIRLWDQVSVALKSREELHKDINLVCEDC